MDDKTYRKRAGELLQNLCSYFDEWDPDEVEADLVPGSLTLTTQDGSKYIVSEQGAHQQMWLATPDAGRRYNYDEAGDRWVDAKDGTELRTTLAEALAANVGRPITFP